MREVFTYTLKLSLTFQNLKNIIIRICILSPCGLYVCCNNTFDPSGSECSGHKTISNKWFIFRIYIWITFDPEVENFNGVVLIPTCIMRPCFYYYAKSQLRACRWHQQSSSNSGVVFQIKFQTINFIILYQL